MGKKYISLDINSQAQKYLDSDTIFDNVASVQHQRRQDFMINEADKRSGIDSKVTLHLCSKEVLTQMTEAVIRLKKTKQIYPTDGRNFMSGQIYSLLNS